jgi:hypothetical protein
VLLTLLLTSEQECIDLRHDLRGSKVVHPDCSAGAEPAAGTATLAFGFGYFHNRATILLDKCKGTVGTEADAHTAACTPLFNAHGKVRFKFDFTFVDWNTCG